VSIASSTAALLAFATLAQAQPPAAGTYTLDRAASVVGFTISGSMVFKVKEDGRFNDFAGTVAYDPVQPANTHVELTVYTGSVDTRDAKHAELLKSGDFFDVEHFPTMTFVGSSTSAKPDGTFVMTGDMTIRGVTKRMTIPVSFRPNLRADAQPGGVFESNFQIDRTEFGLNGTPRWSGLKVSISKNVQIHLAIATSLSAPPR